MMRRAFIQFTRGRVGCGVVAGCKGAAHQGVAHRCAFRRSRNPGEQPWRSQKIIRGARLRGGRERCLRRPVGGRKDRALPELAAELVGLGVDVLITGGSEATRAAKQASASNVIVFPDRVIRSRRGSSAASRAPVPIFPYCRSRPVRRSSTSAAEWSRRVLRRRTCAARDNERAGSIPLLRGSLSSRPDRRFLCTEPLPVAQ